MPVQATVILDSGCFLPGNEKNSSTEIGYFQSGNAAQDIRIIADGKELQSKDLMSLGEKCQIEIRHGNPILLFSSGAANSARSLAPAEVGYIRLRPLY